MGLGERGEAVGGAAAEPDVMFYAVFINMSMVYTIWKVECYSCACGQSEKSSGDEKTDGLHDVDDFED